MRIVNVQIKAATVYIKNLSDSKSLSPEDVDAVLSAFEQVAYVARRLLRVDAGCKLSAFEQGGTSPTLHGSAE
jgi:hypothetical protein